VRIPGRGSVRRGNGSMNTVSSGISGLDGVIDRLRLGDNVVCQVGSLGEYINLVGPYVARAAADNRRIIYFRFGSHRRVVPETAGIRTIRVNAKTGFENFASAIHAHIEKAGAGAFYVFDCLTDLLRYWHSDLMIGNFFRVTCPYLFQLDTVAYFAVMRNAHSNETIAKIRDTTQILMNVYTVAGNTYIHPIKVWQRYSPTMFFPHLLRGQEAVCISSSAENAMLFSHFPSGSVRGDYWDTAFDEALKGGEYDAPKREELRDKLLSFLMGRESRMFGLCAAYFELEDIFNIKSREIGTGPIGGKTVGMLLARKIIDRKLGPELRRKMEMHDSFYLGADVFYTFIVDNGCWELRTLQKTADGYFKYAEPLAEKIRNGRFPDSVRLLFRQMLDYYGQSPVIVRSSSLLEDNFGNAFAGKYESVFCANQGTPEERLAAFENAVRAVYASTMNEDALRYRLDRGLREKDEQMAILIQRVSGDNRGERFFPHLAGVGNSKNLYVWDDTLDFNAGMLRLVFGLGTRAVERTDVDYARMVCLDKPEKTPLLAGGDEREFSQHMVDVIDLKGNAFATVGADEIFSGDIGADKRLFASYDPETSAAKRRLGLSGDAYILDFKKLLNSTDFPATMRRILETVSGVYDYPVDMEFTANFDRDGNYQINILQCRPLQTKGLGAGVDLPDEDEAGEILFRTGGTFMGGNVHYCVEYIVYVDAEAYLALSEQDRFGVARHIGRLNRDLKDKNAILIGPGRWGTSTTSLGVPVNFSEINRMLAVFEVACKDSRLMPELSYGSHFFQDLVESGIFYGAIYTGRPDVVFRDDYLKDARCLAAEYPAGPFGGAVRVLRFPRMQLYADIASHTMICFTGRRG